MFWIEGLCFQKNYMWNTITIQYNPLIEEEWDEHFKVEKQTNNYQDDLQFNHIVDYM